MRQVMASVGLRGAVKLSERLSQPGFLSQSFLKSLPSLSLSCGFRKWSVQGFCFTFTQVKTLHVHKHTSRQCYIKCTELRHRP